ncbi:MAG: MraY family glycosyltransferase [Desulfosarcinaceae bacterium]|nr:MraY family glycosyltransferase [Desulfosarcinaceae bacterium]
MIHLSIAMTAMFITIALVPILRSLAHQMGLVDVPSDRKVHRTPMPKVGGLAMAIGIGVPVGLWAPPSTFVGPLLVGALITVAFGLVDDARELGYKSKLAGQLAAAIALIVQGELYILNLGELLPLGTRLPVGLAFFLTLMVVIGITNAINLSDGLDGLAAGISLLIFICLALLAFQTGVFDVATVAFAIVGAIFGFLRFNTHPATVFMGDTGSQLLGFLAVGLSLKLSQEQSALSPYLPLLILGVPILDTLSVMITRMWQGRSPFVADTNHLHHRLMRLGLLHSEAVFAIYLLQASLIILALLLRFHSDWIVISGYLAFAGMIELILAICRRRGWQFKRRGPVKRLFNERLTRIRDQRLHIIIPFKTLEWGAPLCLLVPAFWGGDVATIFGACYSIWGLVMALILIWPKPQWAMGWLRGMQFFIIPLLLLGAEFSTDITDSDYMARVFQFGVMLLALLVIAVVKYSRRREGFKPTPMDFLIIFIAVIIPSLPFPLAEGGQVLRIIPQVIVLFFAFEVVLGELRGDCRKLFWTSCLVVTAAGWATLV